jgi:hypothetical protein
MEAVEPGTTNLEVLVEVGSALNELAELTAVGHDIPAPN